MAKLRIRIPYLVRELVGQAEGILGVNLGVPMNVEIPIEEDGATVIGTAVLHFEGLHLKIKVETGQSAGPSEIWRIYPMEVFIRMRFWDDLSGYPEVFSAKSQAEKWVGRLQNKVGPLTWEFIPRYSDPNGEGDLEVLLTKKNFA